MEIVNGVETVTGATIVDPEILEGSLDGTAIGATTACTYLALDNLLLDGNTISSTDTNGDINITPHGSGSVVLSKVDINAGTIDACDITVGSGKTLDVSAGTLTLATGQIAVAGGGTGVGTLTDHGVLLGQATDDVVATDAGTAGEVLTSAGASADPDWAALPTAGAATPGIVELATAAEVAAGTDTARAVTAAGIAAVYQYETIFIPAASMVPRTTNGAAVGTSEYTTNDNTLDYYAFDVTTQEYVEFSMPMPENWDRGAIKAKFFWSSASGSSADDTVSWGLGAVALSNDDPLDVAKTTNVQVADDIVLAGTSGDLHLTGATPALTVEGTPALADLINFMVYRNVGGNDNMSEDAWLFGVWIQYKITNQVSAW